MCVGVCVCVYVHTCCMHLYVCMCPFSYCVHILCLCVHMLCTCIITCVYIAGSHTNEYILCLSYRYQLLPHVQSQLCMLSLRRVGIFPIWNFAIFKWYLQVMFLSFLTFHDCTFVPLDHFPKVNPPIQPYTHLCTHAHACAHTHMYSHTCLHTYIHIYIQPYILCTNICMYILDIV